jgi:hypothetical protein
MAMPSSGQINLFGAGKEVVIGAREAAIPDSTVLQNFPNGISLTEISTGTGAAASDPINTYNPPDDRPDGSTPHALSEFYNYDDDLQFPIYQFDTNTTVGYYYNSNTVFDMYGISGDRAFTDPSNTDNPDPIVLTNTKWREMTFRVKASQSVLYRPIIIFRAAGTDDRRDFCLNSFRVNDSTLYHPEVTTTAQYAINLSNDTIPSTWFTIPTYSGSTDNGKFVIDTGGSTPSSNTGPNAGYVWNDFTDAYATGNQYASAPCNYWYFEASGSANGWAFFRLPTRSIGGGSTDEWKFIYSAWSFPVSSWQSSYFEIVIEVTAII